LGIFIRELTGQQNTTREQPAAKCGTAKSYIPGIENNANDIRLSTLMRIVREELGRHLTSSVVYSSNVTKSATR
jgi:predicted transcriptional regulator